MNNIRNGSPPEAGRLSRFLPHKYARGSHEKVTVKNSLAMNF